MATKISEVIESLLEIKKIHGDLPVLALVQDEEGGTEWEEAEVRRSTRYSAMVVRIEGVQCDG